jgi:hypothetical protein
MALLQQGYEHESADATSEVERKRCSPGWDLGNTILLRERAAQIVRISSQIGPHLQVALKHLIFCCAVQLLAISAESMDGG